MVPVGIKTTSPVSVAHLDITGTAGKILVRTDQDDECIDCVNLANSAFSPLRIRGSDVAIQNGSTVNAICSKQMATLVIRSRNLRQKNSVLARM